METRGAIVVFDGECGFCQQSVRFIVDRDPGGYFTFAAARGPVGAMLLAKHGLEREAGQTLILIEEGLVYRRSTAALRIASRLRWPWSLMRVFLAVPAPVRDGFYRLIALVRYKIRGRAEVCGVESPKVRQRML